jgi:hypothetical protein
LSNSTLQCPKQINKNETVPQFQWQCVIIHLRNTRRQKSVALSAAEVVQKRWRHDGRIFQQAKETVGKHRHHFQGQQITGRFFAYSPRQTKRSPSSVRANSTNEEMNELN